MVVRKRMQKDYTEVTEKPDTLEGKRRLHLSQLSTHLFESGQDSSLCIVDVGTLLVNCLGQAPAGRQSNTANVGNRAERRKRFKNAVCRDGLRRD